jgi:DNA-binding beta-propeller fold protein YncE
MATAALAATLACGEDPTEPTNYPPPSLFALDPAVVVVGSGEFTLKLRGADFVRASRVRWNGQDRPTTFVNDTLLEARIAAGDVDSTLAVQLTVYTAPPGGGVSGAVALAIVNPAATITGLAPTRVVAPADSFTLRVTGTGFVAGSSVRFGGFSLSARLEGPGELAAHVPAFFVQTPGFVEVRVANPPPGGGLSAPDTFAVEYPVPVITALSPDSAFTGSGLTLTVLGSGFMPQAIARWNGSSRVTTFVNSTRLQATITTADVATSGTYTVTVTHPAPGGGASAGLPFRVRQAPPRITGTSPSTVTAGAPAFTLTVNGATFLAGAVVRWNGQDRATTRLSVSTLQAEIAASDVAQAGTAEITVLNPGESGASAPFALPVLPGTLTIGSALTVDLAANDIVYDPVRERIWASVPGSDPARGNSVTPIDPATGALGTSISVGSEPGPLAISDDGTYLYVGLRGAPLVVRLNIATGARDLDIDMGSGFLGDLRAEDLVVLPGFPRTLAVSRRNTCCSPRHEGVAIYDDGTRRPSTTQGHTGSNRITRTATAARLFGYNNETTEFGVRTIAVTPSGLVEAAVRGGVVSGFGVDVAYDGGLVYATTGALVDPENLTLLGTFPTSGLLAPDASNGRVHFFAGTTLRTYHYRSFAFIGLADITQASGAGTLIRWGRDGLAFRTGSQIVIVRGTLVGNP